ncbi:hypothetical protein BCR36DRAFT_415279 [Piromyces finnis]|uniref:Uncharacterized protein n=1 Tax=Piromyces finnis TaxID=1754191 RepID=A0A1Y1V0C7_9FUNG|nr:hypothetical protein BCR36DRAFT_415279 [Piromyces finnis]|eukprot:ORX43917.1 hypothetical protein BCR36DRAFT_415279 [Piromyces finnis]
MFLYDKCWHCCCLSKEASVKFCTWLYLIFDILYMIHHLMFIKNGDFSVYVLFFITFIAILSLIFLLCGLKKGKISFLTQFNWIFGAYTIIIVFNCIAWCIIYGYMFKDSGNHDFIEEARQRIMKYNHNKNISDEEITKNIKFISISGIIIHCVIFFITIIYFFSTFYYIKSINQKSNEELESRKLECFKKVLKTIPNNNKNKSENNNNNNNNNNHNNNKGSNNNTYKNNSKDNGQILLV